MWPNFARGLSPKHCGQSVDKGRGFSTSYELSSAEDGGISELSGFMLSGGCISAALGGVIGVSSSKSSSGGCCCSSTLLGRFVLSGGGCCISAALAGVIGASSSISSSGGCCCSSTLLGRFVLSGGGCCISAVLAGVIGGAFSISTSKEILRRRSSTFALVIASTSAQTE